MATIHDAIIQNSDEGKLGLKGMPVGVSGQYRHGTDYAQLAIEILIANLQQAFRRIEHLESLLSVERQDWAAVSERSAEPGQAEDEEG